VESPYVTTGITTGRRRWKIKKKKTLIKISLNRDRVATIFYYGKLLKNQKKIRK